MSGWDDVKQRKLQPIYNAIESRNYKGALKLCAKKDLEKWDIVKALKAYSLERVGRDDEALSLCREVAARQPTDDTLLSTLTMTLKSLGAAEEATLVYENALTKQPDNEETGKELVTCYCRTRHFNKAQVLATRLYKHHPQQHNYALWAGVSMILQVRAGTLPAKMLELSERLVHRALTCRLELGQSLSYEEVMLYLDLLTSTGKHQQALGVLREWVGVEGGKGEDKRREAGRAIVDQSTSSHRNHVAMNDTERRGVECGLLMELGQYREAADGYTHAITHNPDCWSSWKGLLQCLWWLSSERKEGWATEAETLSLTLQASHPHMRGPFLAHMEAIRMCVPTLSLSQQSSLCGLLVSYVRVFGAKLCCFEDVTPYLASLRTQACDDVKASLRQQLTQLSCESSTVGCEGDEEVLAKARGDKGAAMKRLHTYIRTQQVLRFLCDGAVSGGGGVGEWSGEYQRTLFLNNDAQGGQREVQQGDELVLLSAHALLEEASALDKTKQHHTALARRLEACCLLEQCVRYSPYSYSMRLLLLRCYASLGAWEPALHHWNKLEVKQIQCETLSYLLLPPCLHWGFFNEAKAGCVGVLSVHKSSTRECGEQMGKALQCGTYTKALEMDKFQVEKMDKSLQLHMAKVCVMELELCLKRHSGEAGRAYVTELVGGGLREALEPFTAPLTDNQDHSITKSWRDESDKAAHLDSRRERLHHRVGACVLLPRLLLTLLQPDPTPSTQLQSLLDAYKEHAVPLLTPSPPHDTSLQDAMQGLTLTQGVWARKWGRELSLCCLQAATHTLPTLTPTPTPEQVSVAVSSLSSLVCLLDECRVALSRPGPAPAPYVLPPLSPSAPPSLVLPQWIKSTAECVLGSCGYVGLLVERLMTAVHTHTSTSTGGKKKKKGAATDPPAPPPTQAPTQEVCALVRGVCESWVALLSSLEASLLSVKDAHASGGSEAGASSLASTVWGNDPSEAFLTFIGEEDFGDLRVEVVRGVRASQATSCVRLLDVLTPKLKAAHTLL